MTRRCAIYHRVSTLEQDPTLARAELRAAATQRGYDVVLDIEETGSGARNDRPGLKRLMDAARRGQVDAVLVWKLDRFGRGALDLLANVRALSGAGVTFVVISQGLEVRPNGDAMSTLVLTMLAAFAEFERDLIRDRTRQGMRKARAAGKRVGRPRLAPAPDPKRVAEMRRHGQSLRSIGAELGCGVSAARRALLDGTAASASI